MKRKHLGDIMKSYRDSLTYTGVMVTLIFIMMLIELGALKW